MKRFRKIIPLLVAVMGIVAAIVLIENPFSGESSEGTSQEPVVIIDAPQGSDREQSDPIIPEDSAGANLAPSKLLPPVLPQLEAIAGPTPEEEKAIPTPTAESKVAESTPEAETMSPTPTTESKVAEGPKAPELQGITAWINSQPFMISDLRGRVVLVDFWTYTCVNCIRTFPYLKIWHSKYADDGLTILGVHSPEFNFEKKLENVHQAVKEHSIGWPVALDNDFATWKAYENRYWPAKYLIDKDGITRYTHFGEGRYAETESKIRELLEEAGADLSTVDPALPSEQALDPAFLDNPGAEVTRELYGGWDRGYQMFGGYVWHKEYYKDRDTVINYEDPGTHKKHLLYLQGPWYSGEESLKHGRATANLEDYMALTFSAKSVNAVIKPEGEGTGPFKVIITLDGKYLTDSNKGEDVVVEPDGRSFINVDEARMYSLIEAPSYGTYDLKLSSDSPNFAIFAFTFGIYEFGV